MNKSPCHFIVFLTVLLILVCMSIPLLQSSILFYRCFKSQHLCLIQLNRIVFFWCLSLFFVFNIFSLFFSLSFSASFSFLIFSQSFHLSFTFRLSYSLPFNVILIFQKTVLRVEVYSWISKFFEVHYIQNLTVWFAIKIFYQWIFNCFYKQ